MKYETPEMVALTTAISAIQSIPQGKNNDHLYMDTFQSGAPNEVSGAYTDWE